MMDFLVRLAQRSIGQVPVVRARAALAPPLAGDAGGVPTADAPAPAGRSSLPIAESPSPVAAAVQIAGERPAAFPPLAGPAAPVPQAETHAILATRIISEVVERPLPSPPMAPVEREGQGAKPIAAITRESPDVTPPIQPAATVVIPAAPPAPPIVLSDPTVRTVAQAPVAIGDDTTATIDRGPALRPAPVEFFIPKREPHDAGDPTDCATALMPVHRELPPLVGLGPVRPAAPPASVPPSEERIVQVRIGAIEIHAPPPPVATPPAPAPMQRSAPRAGFDEFARLRSYAPWEW
jgi:hypothetical protein